ncbi:hypothetical protein ACE7GA_14600 [Roseomonas sp. CCTCC AB2023176]|uniref:hypothetical protein n=1 Tax=Roseomonas sp. CCTCC AB2023176 TaxID=3342640 RepID=UPI0035E2FA30
MTNIAQGEVIPTVAMAVAGETTGPRGRLRWGVALPIILGLSALLWVGIWYGAEAIIG